VDRSSPSLLPIFRSQQQAELLAAVLGEPEAEPTLTELAARLEIPYASVHREIERAEAAGLLTSRKIGRARLVRANTDSPYYRGLAEILTRAFGVPAVLSAMLTAVDGISAAFVFGSWAARQAGEVGRRPVEDIDLLILGEPDRDDLYRAIDGVSPRLGRSVQVTIRSADWLAAGVGTFHDTVVDRPMEPIPIRSTR